MSAMEGLVEAQIPRLRRYARALTGDTVRADDLVQDTLERAWGRRHLWRAGTDLRAWLFTVMHNVFLNQQRGARPAGAFVELDDSLPLPARPDRVDAQLELRDVAGALAQLPAEYREVLLLVALEEMRYEDVARVLAIPVGTVMSRLSRARAVARADAGPPRAVLAESEVTEERVVVSDAELHAHVDGALDPARRAAVEAWLLAHPEQQDRIAAYQAQNDALRGLFDPVLDEPIPERLKVPARRSRGPSWPGQLAAAAASLIVGIAVGWALRGPGPALPAPTADATLPQRAALAHAVYTPEVLHPVEVGADQEAHLVKWLSKRLDQPLKAPDLSGLGFRLVGGRLLPGGEKPAGQFMYENTLGRRLTLYVSTDLDGNRETAFRFAQERGASVFYWIDGPLGYALVADMDRGPLLQAAQQVYRQLSP